jgi:predicted GNAT superfamily acetyltransferase
MGDNIKIRECETVDEFAECVRLQSDVFALPEAELSPVRHLVVTKNAGGFALGAWDGDKLAGFVLSVPAFLRGHDAFYSHMTGVRLEYQLSGIGARLKWAQRARSLELGVRYIKWTFEPVKARNAYFNLEKLGAIAGEYKPNFYGTDYATAARSDKKLGVASDRLFAEWHLDSPKITALAAGETFEVIEPPELTITIMNDWLSLVESDPETAIAEQQRIRREFEAAFARGLVARGFGRDDKGPEYLLYKS